MILDRQPSLARIAHCLLDGILHPLSNLLVLLRSVLLGQFRLFLKPWLHSCPLRDRRPCILLGHPLPGHSRRLAARFFRL